MNLFGKVSREEKEAFKGFERALSNKPIAEQLVASVVAKNILNGCSWEFCRSDQVFREYEDELRKSMTCNIQKVTYNRTVGVTGWLVSMKMDRLLELLGPDNEGPLTASEVEAAKKSREEAMMALISRIKSGYAGKVGIYYTSDAGTITVRDRVIPAYAVTLAELCVVCKQTGYGIVVGGVTRDPIQVLQREDAVIEALLLAPSANALFIDIGPINDERK